ncbi:MAG: LysR substrate-binding domain-containing protein [Pseudomonadota bacterium]|nr:LysR substrate-binding domain-containing protein [Pseudomonadota bacterium]
MLCNASQDYLSQYGMPRRFSDLKNHFHVGFDEEMGYTQAIAKLESMFKQDNIRHRSNSHLEMIEATRAGLGCSMLSCIIADSHAYLRRLLSRIIFHDQEIWLVTHAEIYRSARIRAANDFLGKILEEDADKLTGLSL